MSNSTTAARRYFVQFPHPGPEGGPARSAWSRGNSPHVRKFVVTSGSYRTGRDAPDRHSEIVFWTEWEAASKCELLEYQGARPSGGPKVVHRPLPPHREQRPRGIPQNTDPFVFGDRFLYTFCAQPRTSARRLHELARGSVLVFGSVLDGEFVLDTLFVVANAVTHSVDTWESVSQGRVPDAFRLTTLEPMYAWPASRGRTFTLYTGATPNDPIDGMYSFVPCTPATDGVRGFARPELKNVPGISPRNARAVKFNRDLDESVVPDLWARVVDCVLHAELALATRAELPIS
jgi:hypothetical protein